MNKRVGVDDAGLRRRIPRASASSRDFFLGPPKVVVHILLRETFRATTFGVRVLQTPKVVCILFRETFRGTTLGVRALKPPNTSMGPRDVQRTELSPEEKLREMEKEIHRSAS